MWWASTGCPIWPWCGPGPATCPRPCWAMPIGGGPASWWWPPAARSVSPDRGRPAGAGRVRRAYLGIGGGSRPLPPRLAERLGQGRGVEVVSVVSGSPAATAGLVTGDVIVAIGEAPVVDVGGLQRLMVEDRIGVSVEV